jgi:hypothetical protein
MKYQDNNTVLTIEEIDQSTLYGVLNLIRNLGLTLLSVSLAKEENE